MSESIDIFEENFRVMYSDVDFKGEIKAVKILNLCQDIASRHTYKMGLSALHMAKKEKIWVVHRYRLEFKKKLFWDEEFKIKTWRYPYKKLYEMRRFDFLDSKGELFVKGLCSWVLVDKKTKRPSRLDRALEKDFCLECEKPEVFETDLKTLTNPVLTSDFRALRDDVDYNNHVNNTTYLKWAKECIEENDFNNKNLQKIEIVYANDCFYNDRIEVLSEKKDDNYITEYLMEIKKKRDNNLLSKVEIYLF
ncbi:MAG: thioesterase [Desulforegulaceae bacterium]|nr:thioesterase [Desulforegulaceae bacterium]